MAFTPLDVKKKTFATQLRGYSTTEVRAFLQAIAAELEELRKERALLAEQLDEARARLETYQKTEKLLQDTLVTAQKATGELRDDARREADIVLQQARLDAERIRLEHEAAMTRLDEDLRRLEAKRATLIDEIAGIARTYLAMAERHALRAPERSETTDTGKHRSS
jgi:cell division initiation protein